uniref:Odorant binding protein 29 n=1 Tax=Cylas formicarius TaxID=197179 RepID=A0A8T9EC01_CYLFO|nr:odorant binding protein 29 [Cylas formicarius]
MRAFILFAFVYSVTCQMKFSPEDLQIIMKHNPECQKESNAQQSMIMGVIQGQFVEDPALKKHILCLGKKLNYIDEDGKFDADVIREKLAQSISDSGKIEDLIGKCLTEKETAEETAYQSIKCMFDNLK